MILEERLKLHHESLTRVIRFTRSADTKAGPVLALQFALVGTLAARFEKLQPILVADQWDIEKIVLVALVVLYIVFLVWVVATAAMVYIPIHSRTGKSLIFFEDVATMEYESFRVQVKEMSLDEVEDQLLDQIYRVSKIASVKMRRVRSAFILSVPSIVLWIVLLAWGSIQS